VTGSAKKQDNKEDSKTGRKEEEQVDSMIKRRLSALV
jgi:hypothetical protein